MLMTDVHNVKLQSWIARHFVPVVITRFLLSQGSFMVRRDRMKKKKCEVWKLNQLKGFDV